MKRKLICTMVMATMISLTGYAQSKLTETQKKEMKEKYEAYKAQLNLNEEQAVKMEEINTAYFEGLAGLKQSSDSKISKYRKFKSLSSERDEKVKNILDEEQYKRYKAQQKEMKSNLKSKRQ
ncbi:hypothetical protein HDC92_002601 [Pedobacter sp. AK017]|uniref:hypothetical protein n=1 Tax=Pedobacter sp. AK017 TaxID=2723073 RepID=UPI00160AE329|nr:hypothetical protein [Pedobacter sp. AK017]MBB5438917.1 hypothetical protein [Pedobacter sp. AK017]